MSGNGCLQVGQRQPQTGKLGIVVLQLPLHRGSPCKFYLIYSLQLSQYRLDVFFGITLDEVRTGRCIERIGHERPFGILVGTTGPYQGIAYPIGQLGPCLADDGRHLKACHVYIGVLVQL